MSSGVERAKVAQGFGAPLWLLLLAVVGSALFTIKLVVESLKTPVIFEQQQVRERLAEIIRHQFYILFAPLGAIFVYQLLVVAGGASQPITVGLAALASGIALNNVLEGAWKRAESATKR